MAAPKAIMPTAPAVSAGPMAAAPAASSAIAATMPTITTTAPGPAAASCIAALAMMPRPTDASSTPAPSAMKATAIERMFFGCTFFNASASFSIALVPFGAFFGSSSVALPTEVRPCETASTTLKATNAPARASIMGASCEAWSFRNAQALPTACMIGCSASIAALSTSAAPAALCSDPSRPVKALSTPPMKPTRSDAACPNVDMASENA